VLEKTRRPGGVAILARLLSYAGKVFDLPAVLSAIFDTRQRPQIPTEIVARSVLIMFLCRLGSLNSMEQLRASTQLRHFLGELMPSADSIGRIVDRMDPSGIRSVIGRIYDRLRRNKALKPPRHGLVALILDGHESHSTYRRHCDGCLERRKKFGKDERIEYYHRNVTAQLVFEEFRFLLDAETQLPGEGELACGLRLLDRVLQSYPRAFHVVVMDALYAKDAIFRKVVLHNKDFIVVLKNNRRSLFRIACSVVAERAPTISFETTNKAIDCWDVSATWYPIERIRFVATRETKSPVRRQLDGEHAAQPPSSWFWLTTLPPDRVSAEHVVEIAHSRWSIENEGFNELVNHWHADHIYKHSANAILNFWLMSMVAYDLFRAFFQRNLKAIVRTGRTMLHFARVMAAELYIDSTAGIPPRSPPATIGSAISASSP